MTSSEGAETHFQQMETSMILIRIRLLDKNGKILLYKKEPILWPVVPRIGETGLLWSDGHHVRVIDVRHDIQGVESVRNLNNEKILERIAFFYVTFQEVDDPLSELPYVGPEEYPCHWPDENEAGWTYFGNW